MVKHAEAIGALAAEPQRLRLTSFDLGHLSHVHVETQFSGRRYARILGCAHSVVPASLIAIEADLQRRAPPQRRDDRISARGLRAYLVRRTGSPESDAVHVVASWNWALP